MLEEQKQKISNTLKGRVPEECIAWYKEAGWHCVVVWEHEFEEFYNKTIKGELVWN